MVINAKREFEMPGIEAGEAKAMSALALDLGVQNELARNMLAVG
jgi:hypothetical protein